jgi:response regulator RpfG family c-di-GMP phosphodiesterase
MTAGNWSVPATRIDSGGEKVKGTQQMEKKKKERTILLVDDEGDERGRVRRILEEAGYGVIEASDYWGALKVYAQHTDKIDMLLTAIALPGNNGYELASAINANDPTVKVLFASGPTGAEVSRFYNMPVAGPHLLSKPVDPVDLIHRVNRVFHTRVRHLHVQRAS